MQTLPKHFMVSECDGGLYDTRAQDWHKRPALRPNYQRIRCDVENNSHAIRAAIRQKFAWPGGYALFGICSDGGVLCADCMRREYRQVAHSVRHKVNDGWQVCLIDCAANVDTRTDCDHCGKNIGGEDETP